MIKIENVEVLGWEHAIRGMYDGKGVRQVYNHFEAYGIDIEQILEVKHKFNITRPYKHGGKVI